MNVEKAPTNPSRRRLARAGAAAPVVLASLASKNAFALPYHCFVSGKLSNNMSAFGPNQNADGACRLPQSRADVKTMLSGDITTFSTIFGINVYLNNNPNNRRLTTNPGSNANPPFTLATLEQILTQPSVNGQNAVAVLETLRRGIVLYKNALAFPPPNSLVPLNTAQIIAMTQAAYNGTSFTVMTSIGDKTFTALEIQGYFAELSA